jgi:hypothetical protein
VEVTGLGTVPLIDLTPGSYHWLPSLLYRSPNLRHLSYEVRTRSECASASTRPLATLCRSLAPELITAEMISSNCLECREVLQIYCGVC